jgi:hypothetical protein
VAIGDSQTYGVSAKARDSWPKQLQQITDWKVYNLSLGGYGPVEYYFLLQNKAFKLMPSRVIVGFYFGNDLYDSYRSIYKYDYWKHLRNPNFYTVTDKATSESKSQKEIPETAFNNIRRWFAQKSILYRIATFSVLGEIKRYLEAKIYSKVRDNFPRIEDRQHRIFTAFTPKRRLRVLNINDPEIHEGLRISLEFFSMMSDSCREKKVQFIVVLIPTKESVFANHINEKTVISDYKTIYDVINYESKVNKMIKEYFKEHDIEYFDVLGHLKNTVKEMNIYPSNQGGHPNKNGYEVIARNLARYLNQKE